MNVSAAPPQSHLETDASRVPKDYDDWPKAYRFCMWGLTVAFLAWFVWRMASGSLWLDETITAWVTNSDLRTSMQRAWNFQGQSPVYYFLIWVLRQAVGDSELALRSLSILATFGSIFVFSRILKQIGVEKDAWIAVLIVCVCLFTAPMVALNARPYALAMLSSLCSMYYLFRWVDDRSKWSLWFYLIASGFSILFSYLFGLIFVLQFIVIWMKSRGDRKLIATWMGSLLVMGVALLPFLPHLLLVVEKSGRYEYADPPTIMTMLLTLLYPYKIDMIILVTLTLGIFLRKNHQLSFNAATEPAITLGLLWWSVGPVMVVLLYHLIGININVSHYYIWRLPALGLLIIGALRLIAPYRLFALPVILLVGFILPAFRGADRSGWKEALDWGERYTRPYGNYEPVVYCGLIESADPVWVEDESFREFMLAPVLYYGQFDNAILLPARFPQAKQRFEQKLREICSQQDRLIVYVRHFPAADKEVLQLIKEEGFELVDLKDFKKVDVLVVRRSSAQTAFAEPLSGPKLTFSADGAIRRL